MTFWQPVVDRLSSETVAAVVEPVVELQQSEEAEYSDPKPSFVEELRDSVVMHSTKVD